MAGMRVLKGHGTGNDFVIIPDLEGALDLDEAMIQALCDRRRGIGADGILRVVRSAACADPAAQGADFFMDYRNADGSPAQMCGNGIRVFARFLVEEGIDLAVDLGVIARRLQRNRMSHDRVSAACEPLAEVGSGVAVMITQHVILDALAEKSGERLDLPESPRTIRRLRVPVVGVPDRLLGLIELGSVEFAVGMEMRDRNLTIDVTEPRENYERFVVERAH